VAGCLHAAQVNRGASLRASRRTRVFLSLRPLRAARARSSSRSRTRSVRRPAATRRSSLPRRATGTRNARRLCRTHSCDRSTPARCGGGTGRDPSASPPHGPLRSARTARQLRRADQSTRRPCRGADRAAGRSRQDAAPWRPCFCVPRTNYRSRLTAASPVPPFVTSRGPASRALAALEPSGTPIGARRSRRRPYSYPAVATWPLPAIVRFAIESPRKTPPSYPIRTAVVQPSHRHGDGGRQRRAAAVSATGAARGRHR
jgi:hypothetical protein